VGYGFKKLNIPIAPIVLGMILGPTVEENFRLAIMTSPEYTLFFTRPVSLLFIVLTILSIYFSIKQQLKSDKKNNNEVL
jgi:putative tricarboxylic transport membrane protein